MEIERKWLINKDFLERGLKIKTHAIVSQFYINTYPEEVRVRSYIPLFGSLHNDDPYLMTIKSQGLLTRKEIEFPIDIQAYKDCLQYIGEKKPIMKDYYILQYREYEIEISIVDNGVIIYAEVEFSSEEEANKFVFPWKDAKEVTNDLKYKMKNYWCDTREDVN